MMQDPVGADRVVRTKTRHDEAFARHVEEHDEREKKIARRSTDAQERRPVISHYHHRQAVGQTEQTAMCKTGRKAMMV